MASKVSWARIITPDHKPVGRAIKIDHESVDSLNYLVSEIKKAEERTALKPRVFMESTGIYHIPLYYFLVESGFEALILNPLITDSNKNQGIRKVKSDKTDALRIAKTAYTHNLKTSLIPSDIVLNIRELVREYHKLTDFKTMHVNKLNRALAVSFPSYASVFSNVTTKTSIEILRKYKTPKGILETPKDELVEFISKVGRRGLEKSITVYEKLIEASNTAITFSHQLDATYYAIDMELDFIDIYESKKEAILNEIQLYIESHKEHVFIQQLELIQTIPGIGFISAVTIMSEMGEFKGFSKPKQLVAYFGLDPTVRESGNFKATHTRLSKRGSRLARRVLFRVALASVRMKKNGEALNPVIRVFYEGKIISMAKKKAIGAVMRKVTNIIFAVLRNNEPFKLVTPEKHCEGYNRSLKLVA